MQKQLTELTDVELKAIAYDLIVQLNVTQQQLNQINAELAKRLNVKSGE
jgi:hypothetical protein